MPCPHGARYLTKRIFFLSSTQKLTVLKMVIYKKSGQSEDLHFFCFMHFLVDRRNQTFMCHNITVHNKNDLTQPFIRHIMLAYQGNILGTVCLLNAPWQHGMAGILWHFLRGCLVVILPQRWSYVWSCNALPQQSINTSIVLCKRLQRYIYALGAVSALFSKCLLLAFYKQ